MNDDQKQSNRDAALRYARTKSRSVQNIPPVPPPPDGDDAELRSLCDDSLRHHLVTCYPNAFPLDFSPAHDTLIDSLERAARVGLLKAIGMPRGSGKTSIVIRSALWALLTGLRRFCCIIAGTEAFAVQLLRGIKTEILTNEMLARLYGRELHALRQLNGESRLATGQRYNDELTNVVWLQNELNFGFIPGVDSSGAALTCCGLTGNIRGQQIVTPGGEILRPDLVLVEDPQTKQSAASPAQCQSRYDTMMGDVLGLAGPSNTISGVCTITPIYNGDLATRLLDREKTPVWDGMLCPMVHKWPDDESGWDEYRTIWEQDIRGGGDGSKGTRFVRDNFERLHAGSKVSWEQRMSSNEVSALQHAYNLRFRDEPTFMAEYQLAPMSDDVDAPFVLRPDELMERVGNCKRNTVPMECEKITAFIDIQKNVLFFMVVAWTPDGRGHVVNYGTHPDQRRAYFHKRDIRNTLAKVHKTDGLNDSIYAGLEQLTGELFGRVFVREDDVEMRLDRLGIDARWGFSTRVVRRFCRESEHSGRIHPTLGQYIGRDSRPWHRWTHKRSDRVGCHCKLQAPPGGTRGVRELLVDTNWWKSFCAERLLVHRGANQSILLFNAKAHTHRMVAEHWAAEEPRLEIGKSGNKVIEWKQSHSGLDNDLWDTLVGCCVLASLEGVRVFKEREGQKKKKKHTRTSPQFVEF